jgi:hypothetical protein
MTGKATRRKRLTIEHLEKKMREAQFFLAKMSEYESRAFGEREPFEFYLSAFYSASSSFRDAYCKEFGSDALRDLKLKEQLVSFMGKNRGEEVHGATGSPRHTVNRSISVGDQYSDRSGTVYASGPFGGSSATIEVPEYYLSFGGVDVKATELCTRYLALLQHMLISAKRGGG